MSVQSQIDRLNAIKQRIRTNLVAQGITVPEDTMLDEMAEQILSVAGEDGQRGTGILNTTTGIAPYTTTVGGVSPKYRILLSTLKTQSQVNEVLVGDSVRYSTFLYPVIYVDSEYAYMTTRVNLQGTAGSAGKNGTDGKDGADGYTPVKGVDYWTVADHEAIVQDVITSLSELEVVNSLDECIDTTKKYVIDGYIYEYRERFVEGGLTPNFTNLLPRAVDFASDGIYNGKGYKTDAYYDNSSKSVVDSDGVPGDDFVTGLIPIKQGDTIRINRMSVHEGINFMFLFDSKKQYIVKFQMSELRNQLDKTGQKYSVDIPQNSYSHTVYKDIEFTPSNEMNWWYTQDLAYLCFNCMYEVKPTDVIITVNEEITYTETDGYYEWGWENTGEQYVKPDYKKPAYFDKPFVTLSFDNFNLSDARFSIVHGEYGYKATTAHKTKADIEINKQVLSAGWDIGLYNVYNSPAGQYDDALSETPTAETLKAWEDYVKEAVDASAEAMVYNPVVWLAQQGVSCYGLETALKKYDIPMCRGAYHPTYTNDFRYVANKLPTITVAVSETLMPSTLEDCQAAIAEAVENGNGVAFLTHGIYGTDAEANANYGITEATLRSFLDTVKQYVDAGRLEVVTYRDIYAMYYPEQAKERDYNRLIKMMTGYNL